MELTESNILKKLYTGECKAILQLSFNDVLFNFSIEFVDSMGDPDCCIAHHGFGIFVRTDKGHKREKYKTLEDLKTECSNKLRTKGIKPTALIITGDDFSQRLPID